MMLASWYEQQGRPGDVLRIGEVADPAVSAGEVRVRVHMSGVNPGDTKKRNGWLGNPMAFPTIIPHSDGAGVIDDVGSGVSKRRIGERVWVYGAQSRRPFGTAAQFTCVPQSQAVPLPSNVRDEVGASLGNPGITAHRSVFADGTVNGKYVLVHSVHETVGALAAHLAHWGGAAVIGTVPRAADLDAARYRFPHCEGVIALDSPDPVAEIGALAPGGVNRVIDSALSRNVDLDAAVCANEAVIAASASKAYRPDIPFWPLAFANVTLRFIYSTNIPLDARSQAVQDLTEVAAIADLDIPIAGRYPLSRIACSHQKVDAGIHGRVLLTIPPAR